MKYLRVRVHQPAEARHPMHQYLVENDAYGPSRQLAAVTDPSGGQSALFHVEGADPGPYEAALSSVETIRSWEITSGHGDGFFVYVRDELSAVGQDLVAATAQPGLVLLQPVVFRSDGTSEATVVGPGDALQAAFEALPAAVSAEVVELGPYDARRLETASQLTDRQFEAVEAAVDCGHYEVPREASVGDVADALGCAAGTAAEHLRRAEATVMHQLVSHGRL